MKEKKQKRRITLGFALAFLFTVLIPVTLNAKVITNSPRYVILGQGKKHGRYYTTVKNFEDGITAYCLEHEKPAPPTGTPVPEAGDFNNEMVWRTMKLGYPHQTWYNTGNAARDAQLNYYVTQMAVWAFVEGYSESFINSLVQAEYPGETVTTDIPLMRKNIVGLMQQAKADGGTQKPSVKVSAPNATATDFNGKLATPHIVVQGTNIKGNATVSLIGAPSGSVVKNDKNEVTNTIPVGGKFYIELPKQSGSGSLSYNITVNGTTMRAVMYNYTTRYQDIASYEERPIKISTGSNGKVNWANTTGSFELTKKGDDGAVLPGATFRIWGNGYDKSFTTGQSGKITASGLNSGTYSIQETSAPPGYTIDSTVKSITIASGKTATIDVLNEKAVGELIIVKKDSYTKETLENAKFRVTGPNGYDETFKVDSSGIIHITDLPLGVYTVRETEAPPGYNLVTEEFTANISEGGQKIEIEVLDHPKDGVIEVIKKDPQGDRLEEVTFRLRGPDGLNETKKTNINGIARWDKLAFGDYTLTEIDTLPGYIMPDIIEWNFTISEEKNSHIFQQEVINTKVKHKVELFKIDSITKEPLPGAVFRITGPEGFDKEFTSNAAGSIILSEPKAGDYTVEEIKSPEGYILNKEKFYFTVEIGQVKDIEIEIENVPIFANLRLKKIDDATQDPLAGAKFTIIGDNGFKFEGVSGTDGYVDISDLKYGVYTITEIEPPPGYNLNTKPIVFEVDGSKNEYVFKMENTKTRGSIEILKVDEETNEPLRFAKFRIQGPNGYDEIHQTNKDGKILLEYLEVGEYTVHEVQAPPGYALNNTVHTINVINNKEVYKVTAVNKLIKGSVEVIKKDNKGKVLEGAEFELRNNEDEHDVRRGISNAEGKVIFTDVKFGNYTLVETVAPVGHMLNDRSESVVIDTDKQVLEFEYVNIPISAQVIIKKIDKDTKEALAGAKFKVEKDGELYAEVISNDQGNAYLNEAPYGTYVITEIEAPNGYIISSEPYEIEVTQNAKVYTVILENKKEDGRIEIIKTDKETGEGLAGVEFIILDVLGREVETLVTDEEGHALSSVLRLGKYCIIESKPLPGYKPIKIEFDVTLEKHQIVVPVEIENEKVKGKLEISKTDISTGELLPNAKFKIYAEDKETVIVEGITDENGKAEFELGIGKYWYQEYEAPEGYIIDDALFPFEIKKDGEIVKAEMTNKKELIDIIIDKEGNLISKKLKGAIFQIHKDGKPVVFSKPLPNGGVQEITNLTTDVKGKIRLPHGIGIGNYQIVEIEAPEGYLKAEPLDFVVDRELIANGENVLEFKIKDNEIIGNVELIKKDKDNGKVMAGVKFKLVHTKDITGNRPNKELGVYTTDANGKLTVKDLMYGEYYFQEVETLEGYILDNTKIHFKVQEHGHTITLDVTNENIKAPLELEKVDEETRKGIPGVVFELYKGKEMIGEYITDSSGKIKVENLVYGKYTMIEKKAAEGYLISKEPIEFMVQEQGHKVILEKSNKKLEGDMELTKTDISTGELLPNAHFKIYAEDKETVIAKGVTDGNGVAKFKLKYGKYWYQEYQAPEGYVIDEGLFPFEIKESGEIVKCQMTNNMIEGEMELTKEDVSTGELLPNASFKIYAEDSETVIVKGKTDENGIARFKLKYGKYFYQEYDAPEGYIIDEGLFPFEIKENGEIVKCLMTNKKDTGNLIVTKVDECNRTSKLPGARFGIYNNKGKLIVEGPTNKDGELVVAGLAIGDYFVKEQAPPVGYIASAKEFKFEIKGKNKTEEIEISNKPEPTDKVPTTGSTKLGVIIPIVIVIVSGIFFYIKFKK